MSSRVDNLSDAQKLQIERWLEGDGLEWYEAVDPDFSGRTTADESARLQVFDRDGDGVDRFEIEAARDEIAKNARPGSTAARVVQDFDRARRVVDQRFDEIIELANQTNADVFLDAVDRGNRALVQMRHAAENLAAVRCSAPIASGVRVGGRRSGG
jgi:hypothetical protein